MCEAASVPRAGYYRFVAHQFVDKDIELRDAIQKVAVSIPGYGYRRVHAELKRRGIEVNHKPVLRIMREDNLLCLRRRSFVRTTDSRHGLTVYPNLARDMEPTGINQLWVADISVPQQAVWKMEVGPPESAYRGRFQTTISGGDQKSLS
jgi:putative transposase